jgi:hypothetical protein
MSHTDSRDTPAMDAVAVPGRSKASNRASGYTECGFMTEFHSHVAPDRERADLVLSLLGLSARIYCQRFRKFPGPAD